MTKRQANMAAVLIGLAPLMQITPGVQVRAIGGVGWLGGLAALPLLAVMARLLEHMPQHRPGRGCSAALALVLLAAAAALVRSAAVRYQAAVGVFRSPIPYAVLLLATGGAAATGPKKALFRASEIFLPTVLALLGVILLCAARQLRPAPLADFSRCTPAGLARAALPVFAVGTAALLLPRVYAGAQAGPAAGAGVGALACLLCAGVVGVVGAPLSAQLELPVFTMLRGLSLLHTVERLDALLAAVWVLPDVTLLALLLRAGADAVMTAFKKTRPGPLDVGVRSL